MASMAIRNWNLPVNAKPDPPSISRTNSSIVRDVTNSLRATYLVHIKTKTSNLSLMLTCHNLCQERKIQIRAPTTLNSNSAHR